MKRFITIYDKEAKAIPLDRVLLIQSNKQYVDIICLYDNKQHSYCEIGSMKKWDRELPDYFIRISRFQIINIKRIQSIDKNNIIFSNNIKIPIISISGIKFIYEKLSIGTRRGTINKKKLMVY